MNFTDEQMELITEELNGLFDDDSAIQAEFDKYLDSKHLGLVVENQLILPSEAFKLVLPLKYHQSLQDWLESQIDVKFYRFEGSHKAYAMYYFKDMVDALLATPRYDVYSSAGKWLCNFADVQCAHEYSKQYENSYIMSYENGYFCRLHIAQRADQEAA